MLGHGLLIAAFSLSAVCFSALLRGATTWPAPASMLVAFVTAFCFFLHLRLADEFKDYEEDSRYRPYRPVPRGLVSLRELGVIWGLTALLQLILALWLDGRLVGLLVLVWAYLGLMSREFFARDWLKARPAAYMLSHMLIMPLIDLYTTACDWLVVGADIPHGGLGWFLVVSYFNGIVIEVGRKIRAPESEEPGVETYSAVWGHRRATLVWLAALLLTAVSAWLAAGVIGVAGPLGWFLLGLLTLAAGIGGVFMRRPTPPRAKWLEGMAGLWTILMYLGLGVIPLLGRVGGWL